MLVHFKKIIDFLPNPFIPRPSRRPKLPTLIQPSGSSSASWIQSFVNSDQTGSNEGLPADVSMYTGPNVVLKKHLDAMARLNSLGLHVEALEVYELLPSDLQEVTIAMIELAETYLRQWRMGKMYEVLDELRGDMILEEGPKAQTHGSAERCLVGLLWGLAAMQSKGKLTEPSVEVEKARRRFAEMKLEEYTEMDAHCLRAYVTNIHLRSNHMGEVQPKYHLVPVPTSQITRTWQGITDLKILMISRKDFISVLILHMLDNRLLPEKEKLFAIESLLRDIREALPDDSLLSRTLRTRVLIGLAEIYEGVDETERALDLLDQAEKLTRQALIKSGVPESLHERSSHLLKIASIRFRINAENLNATSQFQRGMTILPVMESTSYISTAECISTLRDIAHSLYRSSNWTAQNWRSEYYRLNMRNIEYLVQKADLASLLYDQLCFFPAAINEMGLLAGTVRAWLDSFYYTYCWTGGFELPIPLKSLYNFQKRVCHVLGDSDGMAKADSRHDAVAERYAQNTAFEYILSMPVNVTGDGENGTDVDLSQYPRFYGDDSSVTIQEWLQDVHTKHPWVLPMRIFIRFVGENLDNGYLEQLRSTEDMTGGVKEVIKNLVRLAGHEDLRREASDLRTTGSERMKELHDTIYGGETPKHGESWKITFNALQNILKYDFSGANRPGRGYLLLRVQDAHAREIYLSRSPDCNDIIAQFELCIKLCEEGCGFPNANSTSSKLKRDILEQIHTLTRGYIPDWAGKLSLTYEREFHVQYNQYMKNRLKEEYGKDILDSAIIYRARAKWALEKAMEYAKLSLQGWREWRFEHYSGNEAVMHQLLADQHLYYIIGFHDEMSKEQILELRREGVQHVDATLRVKNNVVKVMAEDTDSSSATHYLDLRERLKHRPELLVKSRDDTNQCYMRLLLLTGVQSLTDADKISAWHWVQQSKVKALAVALGSKSRIPQFILDETAASPECSELLREEQSLLEQWQTVTDEENEDVVRMVFLQNEIQQIRIRMEAHPQLAALLEFREGKALDLDGLAQFKATGDESIVFVDWTIFRDPFSETGQRIVLLVVRPGEIPIIKILDADIRRLIIDTDQYFKANPSEIKDWTDLDRLPDAKLLVEPLIELTRPGEILVFSPALEIHRLPLHAVLVPIPEEELFEGSDDCQFLIERNPIIYCPSLTILRHSSWSTSTTIRRPTEDSATPVHASPIAPTATGIQDKATLFHCIPTDAQTSNRFAAGRKSVTEVGKLLGNVPVFNEYSATKSEFLKLASSPEVRLLHFHGHINAHADVLDHCLQFAPATKPPDSPKAQKPSSDELDSSSAFLDAPFSSEQDPNDRPKGKKIRKSLSFPKEVSPNALTAREVFHLRLNPGTLLTLIACSGARYSVDAEHEIEGLIPAFLYAGVGSIVSALWNVPDRDGADFAVGFYKAIGERIQGKAGKSGTIVEERDENETARRVVNVALCFQKAVLGLKEMREQEGRLEIYHWAMFVMYGSWYWSPA